MRPFHALSLLLTAALLTFTAHSTKAADRKSHATPTALKCELRTDPLGIDETAPRLSWQLKSDIRGQRQSAYQILVASTVQNIDANRGDLWDSGRVDSDATAHIIYGGKALTSGMRAHWKVRSWNSDGKVSAYSKAAVWEMGLLKPEDWSAKWIALPLEQKTEKIDLDGVNWYWYPDNDPLRSAPKGTRYFRKVIEIPAGKTVAKARLLTAVDNGVAAAVNGKEVGRTGGWQAASAIDIAPQLHPGKNILTLAADNADIGPAGLLARYHLLFSDGTVQKVDLDSTWQSSDKSAAGWQREDFAAEGWKAPVKILNLGGAPWGMPAVSISSPLPAPYLRKEFAVGRGIRRARLYATALGVYRAMINGKPVSDTILTPGWTDYNKRVLYQTYDVTDLVRRGANAIGVIVGDGWFAGTLGPDSRRGHFGPGPIRFKGQLEIVQNDGNTLIIPTDDTWKGATGPIIESDPYNGEIFDARKDLGDWDEPLYTADASTWKPVSVLTDRNPIITAEEAPPIKVTEELKPVALTEPKPGTWIFDLGQNMVGMARLTVKGSPGTKVSMRFAEVLNPDGTVYRENLRNARATDDYTCKGDGIEVYEPHFTYHGFRYVEVTGYPGKPPMDAILGRVFHSSMPMTSRFECSNPIVTKLYRNVTWGQRANLMSVCTDCPQRDERLGWMGDAQLFARTATWIMDMDAFYTKWHRDMVDAQSPAGGFSDISPRVIDMADGAPAWAEAGVVIPWTMYEVYGDTRILERSYDSIKKYVDLLVSANPNLLWLKRRNNDFGDWVPAGEQTNKDLLACGYMAWDLRTLSRIAGALGKTDDQAKYAAMADKSRDAYNARFLTADGKYTGDTQTAYAMSFGLDLVPADKRAMVAQRFAECVKRKQVTLGTGFIGTRFLLPALTDSGNEDLAFTILQNTRYPSWGYMIEKGATSIWELWNSDTEGPAMNSRNHFAFGSVAEWMQRYLAGIDTDPDLPGGKTMLIRPRIGGGMTHVRGEYDGLYGTLVSDWTRDGDQLTMKVMVPANTLARVFVPWTANAGAITEGGKTVWNNGAYVSGQPGILGAAVKRGNVVALEVGGGTYEFKVNYPAAN